MSTRQKLTTSSMRAKFLVPVLLLALTSVNVYAAFNHPGIFMSEVELDKMKEVVVTLTSTATTGDPGDKITFNWTISGSGITRKTVYMDGETVPNNGTYIWTAIPGTHVLYVQVRLGSGESYIEKYVVVEITGNSGTFSHPGISNSSIELEEIRKNALISGHPMNTGWTQMINMKAETHGKMKFSSLSWKPEGHETLNSQTASEKFGFMDDMRASYCHALMWAVKGDQAHADKSIEIFNDWSATFKEIKSTDHYKYLCSSWLTHMSVMGAEIIRYHKRDGKSAGWKDADIEKYENTICKVFERIALMWRGSAGCYGCQNQDLAVARSRMALGVFSNDQGLFDEGIRLLFKRQYTGSDVNKIHGHAVNLVDLTIAKDGEIMEFNRDAAHGTGSVNCLVNAAEILRQQKKYTTYNVYDHINPIDQDKQPKLLTGSEFAGNAYVVTKNGGSIKLLHGKSGNPTDFTTTKIGHYSAMVVNYYRNILKVSPSSLTKLTEADDLFRNSNSYPSYTLPWTFLTHSDLSKDIQVGVIAEKSIATKSLFSANIVNDRVLKLGYTGGKTAIVKLFTPAGRMVKSVSLNGAKEVSLKNLNHGLYLVKFTADGVSETKKLLLK